MSGILRSCRRLCLLVPLTLVCYCRSSASPFEAEVGELPRALPAEQGLDPAIIAEVERRAGEIEDLSSLLILRNGRMVSERYFQGSGPETAFNVKSVSKSVISALAGIALREGFISGLDQPVAGFFPDYPAAGDPARSRTTVRHLLTMTTGMEWVENGPVVQAWVASSDWVGFIFQLPMAGPPGEAFNYSTAGTHLLSALLSRAAKLSLTELAERYLCGPTGMKISRWDRDPQGYCFGGAELYLTARDLARFGRLYLDGGAAGGRQVLPAEWVSESTHRQVTLGNTQGYGYLWWIDQVKGVEVHFAWGAGGQFLFCMPELKMAVVVTSATLANSGDQQRIGTFQSAVFELLRNRIVPAVID